MKPAISTTALVTTLVGTGLLVFNALGLSFAVGEVVPTKGVESANLLIRTAHTGVTNTWYIDLWTAPQKVWMTLGILLIVGGRLFDARFHRELAPVSSGDAVSQFRFTPAGGSSARTRSAPPAFSESPSPSTAKSGE